MATHRPPSRQHPRDQHEPPARFRRVHRGTVATGVSAGNQHGCSCGRRGAQRADHASPQPGPTGAAGHASRRCSGCPSRPPCADSANPAILSRARTLGSPGPTLCGHRQVDPFSPSRCLGCRERVTLRGPVSRTRRRARHSSQRPSCTRSTPARRAVPCYGQPGCPSQWRPSRPPGRCPASWNPATPAGFRITAGVRLVRVRHHLGCHSVRRLNRTALRPPAWAALPEPHHPSYAEQPSSPPSALRQ